MGSNSMFHGAGASNITSVFFTGWTKATLRACNDMLPSGFERSAPYFKSPFIGHPAWASWQRI